LERPSGPSPWPTTEVEDGGDRSGPPTWTALSRRAAKAMSYSVSQSSTMLIRTGSQNGGRLTLPVGMVTDFRTKSLSVVKTVPPDLWVTVLLEVYSGAVTLEALWTWFGSQIAVANLGNGRGVDWTHPRVVEAG
jgi:hypothetical protein